MKIQSSSRINIRSPDDTETPWITGCTYMPNGHAVLCDCHNSNIKLLDNSCSVKESLSFPFWPWDVSVIDDSNVIITLPKAKQLQFIQIFPQLRTGRSVVLDKNCYGVDVCGDEIYTSCHTGSGEGEVRVLDQNGTLRRKLGVGQDDSFMFLVPEYLVVSKTSKKIFVSDFETSTVTCMTPNGDIVYQYQDNDLRQPRAMLVDADDNIFVCSRNTNNVQVIKSDGRKYGTLISHGDRIRLKKPLSFGFRESDGTVIIGCFDQYIMLVLKIG